MKLKFVNLNLWLGGEIFDPMIDFLKKEDVDILTLQEVHDGKEDNLPNQLKSFTLLKELLGIKYGYFTPCFLKDYLGHKTDNGNAILSRFPIGKTESWYYNAPPGGVFREGDIEKYPVLPRALQWAEIYTNGKTLNIFNTQGVWGKDGLDNQDRLKMGKLIASKIKNKKNVILSGDFNTWENTESMAKVEKYLKNVFKNELTTSFNMRRKTNQGFATAVVDMVYVSQNIKVLKHECPDVDISDHLPLTCEFEV